MSMKKFAAAALTSSFILSACGGGSDLAPTGASLSTSLNSSLNTNSALPSLGTQTNSTDSEIAEAIPKILKGIEDLRKEIRALDISAPAASSTSSARQTTASTTRATTTRTTTASRAATATKTATTTTAKKAATATPAAPKVSNKDKGKIALEAIVDKYRNAQYVELTAEKIEKNLTTGAVSTNLINMWSKAPNNVRIDIVESTTGSSGVSAAYTSGQGDKVKIKKLFIKLDLDKTDERVTSANNYLADKIDMVGLIGRLSGSYDAELIGTTTVEGTKVNILKVSTTGTNDLDSRITHEYLGYEPATHAVRLWELYNGEKDPYFRMVLKKMSFPATISDKQFTL